MKTSNCCKKEAILSHKEQKYFCGGVPGCGKWCEVEEGETPDWEKRFDEKFYNENLVASSSVFHSKYTSREGYLMIDIKQFISESMQKEMDRLVREIEEIGNTSVVLGAKDEWWNGSDEDAMLKDLDGYKKIIKLIQNK